MSTMKRSTTSNGPAEQDLRELRRENRALRRKLRDAESRYRADVQAWAKEQYSEKDLARWEREIRKGVKGGSLIELIRTLETE